ncbi:hypothetical protein PQE75_gp168 [Bacillus phage vB_BcoS-136]|uniref:Uncharacterized protein n=1 Tax=Bacillus phage vB_BcoS-136 TaxID=2419619 RepID=A0A3G3BW68_9CAUD|nr:hypothetical protein PQE75_gp168 [Bacillus phage vB_BcoS-136]AYP68311.1 hypothetical protein vBBcoS136_00197 [Bacillus phage vB_BcoS-136]
MLNMTTAIMVNNMITYQIGISFVGWFVVALMIVGFGFVKACEGFVNNPDTDDDVRMGAEAIIQDYNSRNIGGRIALIFSLALKMLIGGNNYE